MISPWICSVKKYKDTTQKTTLSSFFLFLVRKRHHDKGFNKVKNYKDIDNVCYTYVDMKSDSTNL